MAITVTPDFLRNIAPETEDLKDATLQFWLDQAALSVNEDVWGAKANLGVAYLAAHMYTTSKRHGAGGPVKREKVGDLEVEYGITKDDDDLSSTSYGKAFLRLRRSLVVTPMVVGCGTCQE